MKQTQLLIASLIFLAAASYFQVAPPSLVVGLVTAIAFFLLYQRIDFGVPVMELAGLIACLQWLVGPLISYLAESSGTRYSMYVDEDVYFGYVAPATCLYLLGLLVVQRRWNQKHLLSRVDNQYFFQVGIALLLVSFVAQVAGQMLPRSLAFLFHLISQTRYIAAIYLIFSSHRFKWIFFVIAVSSLLIQTKETAMFHDLVLWCTLIACFWFLKFRDRLPFKALFFVVGFLFVFFVQVVKTDYRARLWQGENVSLVQMAINSIFIERKFLDDEVIANAIVRLNQGWIVSAVLSNVPAREPFAGGETIASAALSSLLPRFLYQQKAGASFQDNFKRFTGLDLRAGTSMGISPVGESYANFGLEGGAIIMLLWGVLFGLFLRAPMKYIVKNPCFLFWVPLIFYQAIKAETEFVVVLNQLVKGTVVSFGVYFLVHEIILKRITKRHGIKRPVASLGRT